MKLLLATQNPGKKEELNALLSTFGVECLLPTDVTAETWVFPEESGNSFADNAQIKAEFIFQATGLDTLADDSGLSVTCLDNFPGVKSARWLAGSDKARNQALLQKLEGCSDRSAFFTCVLCLRLNTQPTPLCFEGIIDGTIALEARGSEGFGYDPIFIPANETKTLAELGTAYKNRFSHRAVALHKLAEYLSKNVLN